MPIYEFRCDDCKAQFEVIQSSSESQAEVVCEKCGSKKTRKTISASSYRLSSGKSSIPAGALSGCSSRSGFS
ncbi:MAG: zinc ribbon domain-containing protein [Proteobacteria bacterium]|nr:zinc ribbon domain-containing protein [Pseudomonadota bacterium]MBU1715090.1 zinc ribbon domain-containing protein [Pseudomonadota bacterium]